MITAFKKYLSTLSLSPISRKLYASDLTKFLTFLGPDSTLEQIASPKSYTTYFKYLESHATAPSMIKRTMVSLRWFGNFISLTYSLPNPLKELKIDEKSVSNSSDDAVFKYIKHFTKYLIAEHLSPLTIKSYKSDVLRYFEWIIPHLASTKFVSLLNEKNIEKYLNYLSQSNNALASTIDRKSKSIRRFKGWFESTYPESPVSDNREIKHLADFSSTVDSNLTESNNEVNRSTQSPKLVPDVIQKSVKKINYRIALSFGILSLFIVALGIFSYRQFSQNVKLTAAFPSSPVTPNRQLSFQGRLEDAGGTPITTATNLTFKLWDDPTTGSQLYTSGVCSLTPDSDGVFSTQIGGTCGSAIASSVFTENANVYLEVTVAAETLAPRQQIASVAYALNSETIQGFPISSTVSAIRNTVVPMNQWGEIIVGEQSPRLKGVSGTFQISAPSLSFITATGTNGNISFAPDGTGQINATGNTTTTNFFNISNAQLTTGSLITGTVANNNSGFKLIDLFSGSSPTSKFSVTSAGNVTLAGDLTITGDDLFMNTNTAGLLLIADGTNFNPTAMTGDISINGSGATTIGADKITESMLKSVNAPTDELCLSYESTVGDFEWQTCGSGGGGSNWRINSGSISPNNDTLDLLVGNTATSSAKAGFININSGTPTATVSAGTAGGAFLKANGYLSTTARQSLTLGNSASFNTTGNILLNPNGVGKIGIGTTNPGYTMDINTTTSKRALNLNNTQSSNASIYGVYGNADVTDGTYAASSYGGYFTANQTSGFDSIGVYGKATGTDVDGNLTGVYGDSINGTGVVGDGSVGGSFYGVQSGITTYANTLDSTKGIYADAAGDTNTMGVHINTTKLGNTDDTQTFGLFNAVQNSSTISTNTDTTYGQFNQVTRDSATGADLFTYGSYINVNGDNGGSGTHTAYGLYVDMGAGPDNVYAGIFNGGNVGIGSLSPTALLELGAATSARSQLNLTSSAGTNPSSPISGDTWWNGTNLNFYNGSTTTDLLAGAMGGSIWTDAGSYLYLSGGEVLGNPASAGINKLDGIYLDDTSPLVFGGDNDISFVFTGSTLGSTFAPGSMLGINTATALATLDVRSSLGTIPITSISGNTSMSALLIDQSGIGEIFSASNSGSTRVIINNTGSLSLDGDYLNFGLTDSSTGYGFRDNGGTLQFKHNSGSWADVGSGISVWTETSGVLSPTTIGNVVAATTSATTALTITQTGAFKALLIEDESADATPFVIDASGNVGIGVASPTQKLEVAGYIVGQRFEDSASSSFFIDPAATGTSISIDGNIISDGAFSVTSNGTNGNITINAGSGTVLIGAAGAGKLDAGTIDPPYTINGDKFATYVAGMTGVKEETTGNVRTSEYVTGVGYRSTLDFAGSLTGSDLWLFSKASSLKNQLDKLVVLISASNNAKIWYDIDAINGQLHLYSTIPTTISYRLTAPRYDSTTWLNTRGDDSESIGHVINDDNQWSVSDSIAAIFSGSSPVISPLSEDHISTISGNIVIRPTPQLDTNQDGPLLVVEGEISASTISARLAELETIQAQNITAKNIVADTITANTIIGLDAKIASLSGISDLEFDSITDRIKARLSEIVDPVTAEDLPIPEEATSSAIIGNPDFLTPLATDSASLSSVDIDFATINNYLAVIGQATITTLDVTSTLYVSSINSKTGSLSLANNTLIIDPLGSVAINGDLTVSGKILAESASVNQLEIGTPKEASSSALGSLLAIYNESGDAVATIDASGSANLASLTTNMITIASSGTATDSSALSSLIGTTSSNATAGVATLASPNTELSIDSPYVTPNSLIYLTPTTNTDNKVLFVKAKGEKSFTVAIDAPASTDISFNWWIIELAPNNTQNQLDQ